MRQPFRKPSSIWPAGLRSPVIIRSQPPSVAHRNMKKEKDVVCVGGYPQGKDYNINYGKKAERPEADQLISKVRMPGFDPVTGKNGPMNTIWEKYAKKISAKK
jgi:uncharacterized protein YjlB